MKSISLASLGSTGQKNLEVLTADVQERHGNNLQDLVQKIKDASEPQDCGVNSPNTLFQLYHMFSCFQFAVKNNMQQKVAISLRQLINPHGTLWRTSCSRLELPQFIDQHACQIFVRRHRQGRASSLWNEVWRASSAAGKSWRCTWTQTCRANKRRNSCHMGLRDREMSIEMLILCSPQTSIAYSKDF